MYHEDLLGIIIYRGEVQRQCPYVLLCNLADTIRLYQSRFSAYHHIMVATLQTLSSSFLAEKDPILLNVYSVCLESHPDFMAGRRREWLERPTPRWRSPIGKDGFGTLLRRVATVRPTRRPIPAKTPPSTEKPSRSPAPHTHQTFRAKKISPPTPPPPNANPSQQNKAHKPTHPPISALRTAPTQQT